MNICKNNITKYQLNKPSTITKTHLKDLINPHFYLLNFSVAVTIMGETGTNTNIKSERDMLKINTRISLSFTKVHPTDAQWSIVFLFDMRSSDNRNLISQFCYTFHNAHEHTLDEWQNFMKHGGAIMQGEQHEGSIYINDDGFMEFRFGSMVFGQWQPPTFQMHKQYVLDKLRQIITTAQNMSLPFAPNSDMWGRTSDKENALNKAPTKNEKNDTSTLKWSALQCLGAGPGLQYSK